MPKSRRKRRKPRPNGRPRRLGATVVLPPSPSPVAADVAQGSPQADGANAAPVTQLVKAASKGHSAQNLADRKLPSWYLPPDSKVRAIALNILAMRAVGKTDEEIAVELKISPKSISPYVYRAAKNGWLTADTPSDRVKYELLNSVVDRLKEGLKDGTRGRPRVRTAIAMKMAEGTLFKEFDQAGSAPVQSTVVAVQVIMPAGERQVMRDDTAGGTPNFAEGQLVAS